MPKAKSLIKIFKEKADSGKEKIRSETIVARLKAGKFYENNMNTISIGDYTKSCVKPITYSRLCGII